MARLYEEDPMAQMRRGAAQRALADTPDIPRGEAPTPMRGVDLGEETITAAPAASPTAIRHEGFGGYTYSFDPNTQELTILEDPTGRVPAGYTVPKGTGPYIAILEELQKAGKASDPGGVVTPMDDEMIFTPSDTGIPEGGGPGTVTAMDEEMTLTPPGAGHLEGLTEVAPPDLATVQQTWRDAGEALPDALKTPEDDESLEGLEARLENLRAKISEKRKAVRERVRQRRGAEATAPPSAGGAQTQAPAMTGGGGVSYEGM